MSSEKRPYAIATATHYVLPRGVHSMVKDADYFRESGGLSQPWGLTWVPVDADGFRHARLLAWMLSEGIDHPASISFTTTNTKTVGALLEAA